MYARITRFEVVDGKKQELADGYRESMTFLKTQKGFQEAILMVDPMSGSVVSVTLWDTKEDMEVTEAPGGFIDKALPLISPYQKTKPIFSHFQVRVRETRS
jgi:hypothetical protein